MRLEKLTEAIDRNVKENAGDGFRTHLGYSVLGRPCAREVWYGFRWFKRSNHTGRILRLFNRGHAEEPRIISWLRNIGAVVFEVDPQTGKQFLASRFGAHIGGSGDGRVSNLERFGLNGTGLLEIKTHNDKSFTELVKGGVLACKPEHVVQMQMYMHDFELPWALYTAINKNNDDLYFEVIEYRRETAEQYLTRGEQIVQASGPPKRINESASWYQCKMCSYADICHNDHPPATNCRSCVYASADVEKGGWYCHQFRQPIPDNFLRKGCQQWTAFPK